VDGHDQKNVPAFRAGSVPLLLLWTGVPLPMHFQIRSGATGQVVNVPCGCVKCIVGKWVIPLIDALCKFAFGSSVMLCAQRPMLDRLINDSCRPLSAPFKQSSQLHPNERRTPNRKSLLVAVAPVDDRHVTGSTATLLSRRHSVAACWRTRANGVE